MNSTLSRQVHEETLDPPMVARVDGRLGACTAHRRSIFGREWYFFSTTQTPDCEDGRGYVFWVSSDRVHPEGGR